MDGQLNLFDGLVDDPNKKPEIGTKVIFFYNGNQYPAVVSDHCGFDYFYIEFTGRKPADDDSDVSNCPGWHVCMRGRKKDWDYKD